MAKIRFAEGSANFACDLCARLLADAGTVLPIVSIYWSLGMKQNRRGPKGEVLWETVQPPEWWVHLRAGQLQADKTILLLAPIVWSRDRVRRGLNGEKVWERLERPGWAVDPYGMADRFGDGEQRKVLDAILVDGVHVTLDAKASAAGGAFVISVNKRGIRVDHDDV